MTSRRGLVPAITSISLMGVALAAGPAAQAASTSVTASTAGSKAVGASTYMWGSSTAPAGTTVCSQVSLSGTWATSQCSTIKSDHSYSIELTYGKTTVGTYTFHAITKDGSGAVTATSPSVTLTRTRTASTSTATTPSPTTGSYQGGVLGTAYTLYSGYNGVKVYLAQRALGMHPGPMDSTMAPTTTSKLKAFQKKHPGLRTDGVLDQATWNALPIEKDKDGVRYPFTIDSWAKTSDVMDDASRDVKVAAEVSFAKAQIGKPYIWGGTGPMGFDCSGLMIQAARAAGMKPTGVSNLTDVRKASDLSNEMWKDGEFQKGSLSNPQIGDFVYYANSKGVVHHVSMYIGNNTVINAVGDHVQYSSLSENFKMRKIGVNRAVRL